MFSQTLYNNLLALVRAIRRSLDAQLILPALCLLYAAIDIMASLERKPGEQTRAAFERWCTQFLLPRGQLECSATDLYAARCGILHTASSEADLVRSGKASPLAYAWGTAKTDDLREAGRRLGRTEKVLHVEELLEAFAEGMIRYLEDVETDPRRVETVKQASGLWLTDLSSPLLRTFLDVSAGQGSDSQ